MMKRSMLLAAGLAALVGLGCMEKEVKSAAPDEEPALKSVVGTAVAAGNFTSLAGALTRTGLVETLEGPGPFTVFAPTDEAFAALPEGTLDRLEMEGRLKDVLLYHVVPGKLMASEVLSRSYLETVQGERLSITVKDGAPMAGNARIVQTDIMSSNGVIHVIDTVLLPPDMEPPLESIVGTAVAAGSFTTLAEALTKTGLVETLEGPGPFTVFAPTDEAFAALPEGALEKLEMKGMLKDVLLCHVVSGKLMAAEVMERPFLESVQGDRVTIATRNGTPMAGGARIVQTDIEASNGVIHVIDKVILPPKAVKALEE